MNREQADLVSAITEAYRHGLFPMADPRTGRLDWYDPDPRGVIPLDGFHVPRNVARRVRSRRFEIRTDSAFEAVIRACAEPREKEPESWIDERIIGAYTLLCEAGHAHSVEAWLPIERMPVGTMADGSGIVIDEAQTHVLVGGLYGVHVGGLFAGESMFSRPGLGGTDASKVCLVHLVGHLRSRGFALLDVQFFNEHLAQFGCTEVPRADYHRRLAKAVERETTWLPFEGAA
jgi:leucyl/phenylalanyl-tRNA--protein transferase